MIVNEQNKQLISLFIEQLETYGIEIGTKLDQLEKEKQYVQFLKQIREALSQSKTDFCKSYFELEEEEKQEFQKRLLKLFKDQEIVDNIIQEIINYYYLKEAGLLDLEEIAPQKEIALENLETLSTKTEKYIQESNMEQLEADEEHLSLSLDKLVDLGSILEGESDSPISDIDYLEELLELSSLSDEEKKTLLREIVQYNIKTYKRLLEERKQKVAEEIEANKQEAREELEEYEIISTVSMEQIKEINRLLSQKDIIQTIVRIVNDDFSMMINIADPTEEEKDMIESSLELAREEIIALMEENQELTPEKALELFVQTNDELARHKQELLEEIFKDSEPSTLSKEEQEEVVAEAMDFLEKNKGLLTTISRNEKERIHQYMKELYNDKKNREMIYESKSYTSDEEVEKHAAYEIQVIKSLLEVVDKDSDMYSKISRRLEEILSCVREYTKKEPIKTQDEGNIFFLMKSADESQIETDLGLDSKAKGTTTQSHTEIKTQLEAISKRGERTLIAAQPVNPAYKYIRKQGVRYTTGSKTRIFFIPVGKKDAIIIGAGFLSGKDMLKEQDMKIKRHLAKIEELKEKLGNKETYDEEKEKSRIVRKRMMEMFNNKELDEMFEEDASSMENEANKAK